MVDVSSLMRALLGTPQTSEAKLLELKPGQVVRGVVLKLLADSEALMNIMGNTVRARLETPLAQGQSTLLQVQPEMSNGLVALKPLSASSVEIASESLPEVLKSVGLKDTALNRMVLSGFHSAGVPLTMELAQTVSDVLQDASPDGREQAMKAAVAAVRRGLPVTGETVGALRTVLFGGGIGELLGRLEAESRVFIADSNSGANAAPKSNTAQHAVSRVLNVLARMGPMVSDMLQDSGVSQANQPVLGGAAGQAGKGAHSASAASAASLASGVPASTAGSAGSVEASAPAQADQSRAFAPWPRPPLLALLQWMGVDLERQIIKSTPIPPAVRSEGLKRDAQLETASRPAFVNSQAGEEPDAPVPSPVRGDSTSNASAKGTDLHPMDKASSDRDVLDRTSSDRTSSDRTSSDRTSSDRAALDRAWMERGGLERMGQERAITERPVSSWSESLKAAVLQLESADGLPPALKEAVQQTLQWITGQQLLLSSDRNTPFIYTTLFIPFGNSPSEDGSGSASVHIQTRKGMRGEWDAENCRLWFELRLAQMGETSIDVQVTNKIVSLHVFNSHPSSSQLIENSKTGIDQALEKIGYRLSSLRISPVPKPQANAGEAGSSNAGGNRRAIPAEAAAAYGAPRYRGVDVRI